MRLKKVLRYNEVSSMIEIIRSNDKYKENSENGLVILLNGEWGTGKTTFLNDLINEINKTDDIELFYKYNAYENDYCENAYIPFFSSIEDKIKLEKEFSNFIKSVAGEVTKDLIVVSYAVTKSILKKKFDFDIDDIKNNLDEIQNEKYQNEKYQNDYVKNYRDFEKYKDIIKGKMNNICLNKKQLFIIDELDRCKPNFAMDTLEIVKHFFDINNCVFIISVDKLQLQESAKATYGFGINSEKYFSKLFDYQFNLLPINFADAIDSTEISTEVELIERATTIFNMLNISLRDSKKIFNELIEKNKKWTIEQSMFMLFMFILKYTDLSFYNAILQKDYIKYKKAIEGEYNKELEKYNKLFYCKIGDGLIYGEILECINLYLNHRFDSFGNGSRTTYMSIGNHSKSENEIEEVIKKYVPRLETHLTVKQTIKNHIN